MKEKLLQLLRFDSIYRILTWEERISVHRMIQGKEVAENEKIDTYLHFLKVKRWKAPAMRMGQDRLMYFQNEKTGQFDPIDWYAEKHPFLTAEVEKHKEFFKHGSKII